ncbi:MAG TPA: PIN domain-containing protein [Candidatus Acidoferrales bacterium]|nr:PIN domain-containing protein [Candidatus Acidoferrales bacterium]
MAKPPMFDTNVIISGAYDTFIGLLAGYFMSAVVVQELLVGKDPEAQRTILSIANQLERRELLVVPTKEDWYEVGKQLARLMSGEAGNHKLSKQEVSTLVKDALIARTAMRMDAVLVTDNTGDFAKIKTVFRSLVFKSPSEYFGVRPR